MANTPIGDIGVGSSGRAEWLGIVAIQHITGLAVEGGTLSGSIRLQSAHALVQARFDRITTGMSPSMVREIEANRRRRNLSSAG
jgi:hypothetical protein